MPTKINNTDMKEVLKELFELKCMYQELAQGKYKNDLRNNLKFTYKAAGIEEAMRYIQREINE